MCQTLSVTLGGAYDGGGAYPMALQSRELLQWVVGWQHERWRRPLVLNTEVAEVIYPVR